MSISFAPPLSGHAFSSCLKRSLPSGGFHDMDDTLRRKRSRDQNEGFRHGIASPSSGSLTPEPSAFLQGPKSLQQVKAERSMKTSSAQNLERSSDCSPSIRKTILCLSGPSAATTAWKRSKSTKDSERDFEGPKSLAEILKEKRQRQRRVVNGADQETEQALQHLSRTTTSLSSSSKPWASKGHDHHVDELQQKPDAVAAHTDPEELEEGEFRASNSKDSDVGSKLKSTNAPSASSMPPAEDVESQVAAASRANETTTLGTAQPEDGELDIDIDDDDADFEGDIDIDQALLERFFDEQDFISCKNDVTRGNETTTLGTAQPEDGELDIDIDDDDADFEGDIDIDQALLERFFDEQDFISCKNYVTRGNETTTLGTAQPEDGELDIDIDDDADFDGDIDIDEARLQGFFDEQDFISCKNYVTRGNDTTTLSTAQPEDGELDIDIDDDADFDGDFDIDEALLQGFFDEQDFISCKNYVTSWSHL